MNKCIANEDILEVKSVLGKKIRTTHDYWKYISEVKHADLAGQLEKVFLTLTNADEVWHDQETFSIFLYYYKINGYWICVVTRHLNGDGFIVTSYLTRKFKRKGKKIWSRKNRQ